MNALLAVTGLISPETYAEDSVCAKVKMEVAQELTLERQAFDAHMRINNGLDLISLENVGVEVSFLDQDGKVVRASSDGGDASASFFIRLNSLENIRRVDGLGTVAPRTSADIHWLIIPAPGASNGVEAGSLYYVGATLSYTLGGESHSTTVTPDHIFVKPMPEMVLDYFLPIDIFGDDAFTAEVEPPVPFSLGVRIKNNGTGTARDVRIESAQPRIVENAQGLQIGFAIAGSEVNGNPATKSLLVDFGDITPDACATARWTMTCYLSGKFVEFKADFSHADELGGELTSLIDSVNTHLHLRDVLVDLPGRDAVKDFLARDGGVLRVYESQGVDTVALDQSGSSSLQHLGQTGSLSTYSLSTPPTAGFLLIQLADPSGGEKVLKEVLRSDGKRIKPENCWLASPRATGRTVQHTLSLFDANSTGSYRIVFDDPGFESKPPVLQAIPEQRGVEGQPLTFSITAVDPDGTIPALSASPLPAIAKFTDAGGGLGTFSWMPAVGQAGRYDITFAASDGELMASQHATLTICSAGDSDCDGMSDAWELAHFGNLDRDGKSDLDGDGISDFDEYWRNTDPTRSNAPTTPVIVSPLDGSEVSDLRPELTVQNATDPDPLDHIGHDFELYSEPGMINLVAQADGLLGANGKTTWTVSDPLDENTWTFFRVRATDGGNYSEWAYGSFFLNTVNEAPGDFNSTSPGSGAETGTLTPTLSVTNSSDPDGDALAYAFEVYSDRELSSLVASGASIPEGENGATSWTVASPLSNHRSYFWRATATDEHGKSAQTQLAAFTVNLGNQAPAEPVVVFPPPGAEVSSKEVELVFGNATDPDGDPLTYTFELDRVKSFDSPHLLTSEVIAEGAGTTRWKVSGLSENAEVFFRGRASDGAAQSPWAAGSFFVNSENEPPSTPTIRNPGDGSRVQTVTPVLELNPSVDLDRDRLSYRFEIYGDASTGALIARGDSDNPAWTTSVDLPDNNTYFFRGKTIDEHGAESGWTPISSFFVNNNGIDDPPEIALIEPSTDLYTSSAQVAIRWRDSDPDSNADISLTFAKEVTGANGTPIGSGLKEDPDGPSDSFLWDTSTALDGTYWIRATIADAGTSRSGISAGKVTLDRTPPVVQAVPKGGVFQSPQTVTLSASEPGAIFYTLDGAEPTLSSPQYASPIEVNTTATLRFMAVDRAGNASSSFLEAYTIVPGSTVSRFAVSAPPKVKAGLGFTLTIKALSKSGALARDFNGHAQLSVSAGVLASSVAEGFVNGVWKNVATLSGAEGPVTITATLNGITGESKPIVVRCDSPRPPVPKSPRDRAQLLDTSNSFTWHGAQGAVSYKIEFATDPEFSEVLLAEDDIPGTAYTPPASFFAALEPGETYNWRVLANGICGSGDFSKSRSFVYESQSKSTLIVTSPAQGDTLSHGDTATIQWDYTGTPGSTIRVSFSAGGRAGTTIATGIPISGKSISWTVPSIRAKNCEILIESEQHPKISARSGRFSIR